MTLTRILDQLCHRDRNMTVNDIRNLFGDYHNVLRWLALFLMNDEKRVEACIVDACSIAPAQAPLFHEWLVHWGARATVRAALQMQATEVAHTARQYAQSGSEPSDVPPLSVEQFHSLVKNSTEIQRRLDPVCRLVLVLRGIARDSCEKVATQLGIPHSAVNAAYLVAFNQINAFTQEQQHHAT